MAKHNTTRSARRAGNAALSTLSIRVRQAGRVSFDFVDEICTVLCNTDHDQVNAGLHHRMERLGSTNPDGIGVLA